VKEFYRYFDKIVLWRTCVKLCKILVRPLIKCTSASRIWDDRNKRIKAAEMKTLKPLYTRLDQKRNSGIRDKIWVDTLIGVACYLQEGVDS